MNANVPVAGSRRARLPAVLCAGGLLATAIHAHAGDVTVHGFGTVGLSYVDKPEHWAFARTFNHRRSTADLRTDVDSVIGIQLNYQASAQLEFVAQAAASRLDPDAPAGDFLDLAFIGWHPDPEWSMRLGRVNLDAYLISDHRDVGFTYQPVRPPLEYYARMPTSLDGGDIARTWTVGDVQWQAKLFAGATANGPGDTRLKLWPVTGVVASRESDGLLLRISAVHGRTRNDIAVLKPLLLGLEQMQALPVPGVAAAATDMHAALATGGMHTNYVAAALGYDRHDWLVTAEVNRSVVEHKPSISFTSGYVTVGRRFGAISASLTRSLVHRDSAPFVAPDWQSALAPIDPGMAQQAQQLADGAARAINTTAAHQATTSLGMRWDVAARLALKAQWDHVDSRRDGSGLWLQADGRPTRANVFTVAADFVF
jgi:hypothetical protein